MSKARRPFKKGLQTKAPKGAFEKRVEDAFQAGVDKAKNSAPARYWEHMNKLMDEAPNVIMRGGDSDAIRHAKLIRDVLNKGEKRQTQTLEELTAEARELDLAIKMAENFNLLEAVLHQTEHFKEFANKRDPLRKVAEKNRSTRRILNRTLEPSMKMLRKRLTMARRFHLSDEFVVEATRKADSLTPWEAWEALQVAKLPFEHMWIEFDNQKRLAYAEDEDYVDPERAIPRGGFLLSRTPGESMLMTGYLGGGGGRTLTQMAAFLVGGDVERAARSAKVLGEEQIYMFNKLGMLRDRGDAFAHGYEMTPWHFGEWSDKEEGTYICEPSAITRMLASKTRILVEPFFWNWWLGFDKVLDEENSRQAYASSLADQRGDVRFVVAMLAMINLVPIKYTYKPSKPTSDGYQGKDKPYLDYQVVEIEAGRQKVINVVNHAFRAIREKAKKRAHEVRGHMRVYHKGTPKEFRVWIKEHQRGDASLGFVRQTWEVTTEGDKHA